MKKTKVITAVVIGLALTVMAGEAIGQPGRRGRGGQGWDGGPGWGRRMAGGPQMNADLDSSQPDNSWNPGPYCPFGQDPNQNIQGWQSRGPGAFGRGFQGPRGPYYPFSQGPNQNIQGQRGRGPSRLDQDYQGRGLGPYGQGYGRRDMMMQHGPRAGRGGRGAGMPGRGYRGFQGPTDGVQDRGNRGFWGPGAVTQGRGGRGFQHRNFAPQDWGMNNWQGQPGPRDRGGQGPRLQQRWFAPGNTDQTNQPTPPRGRGWTLGPRQGWTPGWGQDWTPDWNLTPQPEEAPDSNAPEPPIDENQVEQPQSE